MILDAPVDEGTTRLVLVRHAEPEAIARGRCHGRLDVPLSARGRLTAEALARALARVPLTAVYSSPLRRALETAAPIAAAHRLAPVLHDGLRELDFGELEGARYEDIAAERPELFQAWMESPTAVRFPGGEAFAELRARAVTAAEELRLRHAGSTTAVVAHGGVTRTILAAALAMPDDALFRLGQPYGAVSVVDWLGDTPVVQAVNLA
ncbi:MAG: histidine phosphatase family protein [Thermoleophilaceae bacterium]